MTWNIWNIIRLGAFVSYSLLLFIVLWRGPRTRPVQAFILYLISMVIWSLGSFLMHAEPLFGTALFWNKFMVAGIAAMPILFYSFIRSFLGIKKQKKWLYLGAVLYISFLAVNIMGYTVKEAYFLEGVFYYKMGIAGYLVAPGWFLFIGLAAFNLIQNYRKARDSFHRNRLKYLFIGILIMAAGLTTNFTKLGRYPLDISINTVNALLIAYVIFRYKLIDLTSAIAAESIVETMSDSLLLVTPEGKIETVNPVTLNLLGYKEDEIVDQPVEILFAGEKLFKGREFDDLIKKERVQNVEKTYLSKDGRKIPVLFSSTIMRDDESKIKGIVCIAVDLTKHKQMEKALAKEYNLLQTLMDNIPDFIYFKDEKNRFIKVDKISADHVGITPEEMIGKTDFDFFPEEEAKKFFADDSRVVESNKPLIDEIRKSTSPEGKERWTSTTKIPRHNEKGEAIGTMGISRDITKHKKTEEELRKTQEELMRSEKLAVLGKLTGAVGHELRNPLGAIKNSVYFLRMRLDQASEDEKIKKHLDILEEEINISDKIITDMLTFGRIKEPQLAPANINNIIKGCLEENKVPGNIKVSTQLNSQLPQIQADEGQLKEVFSNIILNAIQAMPKGGELTITTARKDEFIETDIADTGEGISKENLEKIFDPLFSTKPRGTGLGLLVCQSIIEGHKGAIEVKSEVEKKTKFIVKLPIRQL